MRKSFQFKPSVAESRLEDRVVMAAMPTGLAVFAPAVKPVTTTSQVNATLNQLHSALLTYEARVTNVLLFAEFQINAGKITTEAAVPLLESVIGNYTSQLFFSTRAAAGRLPFGAGFNGFVNNTFTSVGDLPSGAESLYADLTFPEEGGNGPIGQLEDNVFTPLDNGDLTDALNAVDSTAIHATYAQVKQDVVSYVVNGVAAHDFRFRN